MRQFLSEKSYTKILPSGIWLAIVSSFWISVMLCMVRYLSPSYNALVIVFWRSFFALLLMTPWLLRKGVKAMKTTRIKLYFLRAFIGTISMVSWFYALGKLPLPYSTALSFTAPVFSSIAAVFFLKEKARPARIMAIILGFIGMMIIIRPGMADFSPISLIIIFSTCLWAIGSVLIKTLSKTESPESMTFYMTLMMTPMILPLAIFYWQEVKPIDYLFLAAIGLTSNLAQISLAKALVKTDLIAILPFDFMRLVFISIMAFFLYGDRTNIYEVLGSFVIILSSIFVVREEKRYSKNLDKSDTSLKAL